MKWCPDPLILSINISPGIDKEFDDLFVPIGDCQIEWCCTFLVISVIHCFCECVVHAEICASSHQCLNDFQIPSLCRQVKRRPAVPVLVVHVRTSCDERFHSFQVALFHGPVQLSRGGLSQHAAAQCLSPRLLVQPAFNSWSRWAPTGFCRNSGSAPGMSTRANAHGAHAAKHQGGPESGKPAGAPSPSLAAGKGKGDTRGPQWAF